MRKSFVEKIIEQLAIRFEHRAEIVALDIFDPRSIPRDESEVASYGKQELKSLFDFYTKRRTVKKKGTERSVFEAPIKGSYSVLEFEWTLLKNELFSLNIHAKPKDEHAEVLEAFYAKVLQREEGQQGRYGEDMTFLISMYLCLVTSSVCCETGFSRWLSSPLTLCMRVEYR
jgi:hypothetical protein